MKLLQAGFTLAILGCQTNEPASTPVEIVGELSDTDYLAEGAAPLWQLLIDSKRITLTFDREGRGGPASIRNYFYPLVIPTNLNGVRTWRSTAESEVIVVEVSPGPCERQDGFRFEDRVRVRLNEHELSGCGGDELAESRSQ